MYDTTWWAWLVTGWEVVVYNQVLDLQQCWQVQLFASQARAISCLCKGPCSEKSAARANAST